MYKIIGGNNIMFLGMVLFFIGFTLFIGSFFITEKVSRILIAIIAIIGIITMIIGAIRLDNAVDAISASTCLKKIEIYNS